MSKIDVIRAWKDEEYRSSLSEAQRAMLPENPAGFLELTDEELESVGGANAEMMQGIVTLGCSYLFCTFMWPVCTIPSL